MDKLTVKVLRERARKKHIKYWYKLRKAELINKLKHKKSSGAGSTSSRNGRSAPPKRQSGLWTIYTIDGCDYCVLVKNILKQSHKKSKIIKVTDSNEKRIYSKLDGKTNKYRYFPMIFYNNRFIGGYQEFMKNI